MNNYQSEEFADSKGRTRNGSPTFYKLLETMAELHDRKSHDYASSDNPSGNYHFAGMLSKLFNNPDDAGFIGRIGEKLYRLANLENAGKLAKNETIADTELDICVIVALWMADRRDRRSNIEKVNDILNRHENPHLSNELRLKYDDAKERGPEPVDSNPHRNTNCYFCAKEVNTDLKIIVGKYKQSHVDCFENNKKQNNRVYYDFMEVLE